MLCGVEQEPNRVDFEALGTLKELLVNFLACWRVWLQLGVIGKDRETNPSLFARLRVWLRMRLSLVLVVLCAVLDTGTSSAFNCLKRHCGTWAGVQSLHDYGGIAVIDSSTDVNRKLTVNSLLDIQGNGEVQVSSTTFKCDVDWSSTSAVPSADMLTQPLGSLNEAGMPSNLRFIGDTIIGGPNIVPNSHELTFQLTVASEPLRLKLNVVYEAFDFVNVPGTSFKIPFSFVCSECVLTREVRLSPGEDFVPSAIESAVTSAPASLELDDLKVVLSEAMTLAGNGESRAADSSEFSASRLSGRKPIEFHTESVAMPSQAIASSSEGGDDGDDEDEEEEEEVPMIVVARHGGDVLVELPRVIVAGELVSARLSWRPKSKDVVLANELFFSAMKGAVRPVKRKGALNEQIDQPVVDRVVVSSYSVMP